MGGPRVSWQGQFQEDTMAWMSVMLSVYRCVLSLILLTLWQPLIWEGDIIEKRRYCIYNNSTWNSLTGHSLIFRHALVNWVFIFQRKSEFTTQLIIIEAGMAPGLWSSRERSEYLITHIALALKTNKLFTLTSIVAFFWKNMVLLHNTVYSTVYSTQYCIRHPCAALLQTTEFFQTSKLKEICVPKCCGEMLIWIMFF